ncbi:MAG: CHASE2 domain-containing protein [Cyanobacteria bacterium]|nr:CHASE2 domain-containing protein [Cyanobacteriota bacterium]
MIGTVLANRYRLLKLLGAGGFGRTYLAIDLQQGEQHCVVKHLTPANRTENFLQTARRLFDAEAKALQQLGQHDRIPQLVDAFEADAEFYLVQAYVDGHTLTTELQNKEPWSEQAVIDLLAEVLPTLAFIHGEQVIHRDIKPSNLMRRQDGKIALIDFGAVKEITTQVQTGNLEQFTVSIGTQGYAPAEQLSGRPRYSSDLYALGITAIQALTGRSPMAIPEHPETGELCWQELVPDLRPGLGIFLSRLAHSSVYQRYTAAEIALDDLGRLDSLSPVTVQPIDQTALGPHGDSARLNQWLPGPGPKALAMPETVMGERSPISAPTLIQPTSSPRRPWEGAIAPVLIGLLMVVIRSLGGWMPLELMLYDKLVQAQPPIPPDPRLLVVEITETDLQKLQRPTPADQTLAEALVILQSHQPRVIGLDLHRELPQGEGHDQLLQALAAPNIIAIQKIGDRPSETVPAPASVPPERVGFNDLIVDPDGVIRRNLLLATTGHSDDAPTGYSLGFQVALQYLAADGLTLEADPDNPSQFQLAGTVFEPLSATFGGYQSVDGAGYQVMLNYDGAPTVAERLSLTEILTEQFDPAIIRDRAVLIGTTAPSAKDLFYTPYSRDATVDHQMAGVMLHAQMASQILKVALDGQALPWTWPNSLEVLWILGWAAVGGGAGWGLQKPWWLPLGAIVLIVIPVGIPLWAFAQGGWLPLWPAPIAFAASLGATVLHRSYRHRSSPAPRPLPPAPMTVTEQLSSR